MKNKITSICIVISFIICIIITGINNMSAKFERTEVIDFVDSAVMTMNNCSQTDNNHWKCEDEYYTTYVTKGSSDEGAKFEFSTFYKSENIPTSHVKVTSKHISIEYGSYKKYVSVSNDVISRYLLWNGNK